MKQNNVYHRYLSNGMEVYLLKENFAPVVSLQLVVKTGSIDEGEGEEGLAHVLEHMLFKGTKKFPMTGDIAGMVEAAGGDINAYTTFDHTNYFITAPSSFAFDGIDLLLEMTTQSLFEPHELKKELEVIVEEIKRGRDNPKSILSQNLFSAFYHGTPYARAIIGYQSVVENLTQEHLTQFYKRWYVPNNMCFVVVGDIDIDSTLTHIEKLCEEKNIIPGGLPERIRPHWNPAVLQNSTSFQDASGPWQELRCQIALPGIVVDEPEHVHFDSFAYILGGAENSTLVRLLRDELQLVTSISVSSFTPRYPAGMLSISFYAKAENFAAIIRHVIREIYQLTHIAPGPQEMERLKKKEKANLIYSKESMNSLGSKVVGYLQTQKKMDYEDDYLQRLEKSTGEDLKNVAQKVFQNFKDKTFAVSVVRKNEPSEIFQKDHFDKIIEEEVELLLGSSFHSEEEFLKLHNHRVSELHSEVQNIEVTLSNQKKIKINYRQNNRLPLMSGMLVVRYGTANESPSKVGVGALFSTMLTRGTQKCPYQKFQDELVDLSSHISSFCSRDFLGFRFDALSEAALRTFQLVLDCLFIPEFSPDEFEKIKIETDEILKAQEDNAFGVAAREAYKNLFPNHNYGNPSQGTRESLKNISLEDVKEFWQDVIKRNEFVLSLTGSFSLIEFVQMATTAFKESIEDQDETQNKEKTSTSRVTENNSTIDIAAVHPLDKPIRTIKKLSGREQAQVIVSYQAGSLLSAERMPLEVAAMILSGQSGRLFMDLRDEQSLAYSVSADYAPLLKAGVFMLQIGCSFEKVNDAIKGLKKHMHELVTAKPPTEDELEKAKKSLINSASINAQYLSYQASQLAMPTCVGHPFDHFLKFGERVNAVNSLDVVSAVKKVLEGADVITVVGPEGITLED